VLLATVDVLQLYPEPSSMEVWWIGEEGSVQGALGNVEGQWRRFELGF
jgi:hypothetical protein